MEIDFTNCDINRDKMYGGRNGKKLCIKYDDHNYMLKFPPKPTKNQAISYTNSCVSEYISCHVLNTLNIEAQDTILGTYQDKIVVACKDFTNDDIRFQDFICLKNTILDNDSNGGGTELSDILHAIDEQRLMPSEEVKVHFWRMFIGDILLGNFDRHNGNWGFLTNLKTKQTSLAPVFDCGSCLYPQLDDNSMRHVLQNRDEIDKRLYIFPNSAIKQEGVKINYARFLLTTEDPDCIKSLVTIGNRIDMKKIMYIIDNTPYISDTQKEFFAVMIKERKEKLIDPALKRFQQIPIKSTKLF